MVYVIPVTLLSFALNIPKFIEVELFFFFNIPIEVWNKAIDFLEPN